MEYAEGGELFNYVLERKYLSENESRIIFQQIIDAVYYLHQIGVCHRDLKLENILFSSKNKDKIKIIDFGLSNLYLTGVASDNPALAFGADFLETPCGSPSYTPPEMILGCKYDGLLSDIWSCGIILFSMLCGFLPFDEPNEEKLYSKIIKGEFFFPSQINISDEAKCLVQKILVVNPRLRASIKDIRRDPWFLNDYKPILGLYISIRDIPVSDKIIEEMEKYNFDKKSIIENIKNNRHNKITTFYYLLVKKYLKEGKQTESDLISNIFNKYLREQDLKNKLLKKGEKPISLKIMKYNSKPLFDLKEENNNDNSNQNFDLEYLKNLLNENILNISEEDNDTKKMDNNKENILDKEESKTNIEKNQINNINIYLLKNKTENKKDKKDSIKKINKVIHNENRMNEKSKNNSNIFEFKNKYSNLTSINKRKKIISESEEKLSKYKKKEKKIIKENINENRGSNDNKRAVNIKEKKKEKSKMNNQKEKNSNLKVNELYCRSKKNKIYVDTKSISNNIANSSINLDIMNSINNNNNNMNMKINKIKKLKDQNLKKAKSKNKDKDFKIGSYFEYCSRGIIPSRNYFKLDLNNELKTSRQYRSRFALQSSSNSKSKSKSLRSKSIYTAEKINGKKIFYYNISKNKVKNKIKNYFNVKISNMKPSLLTEGSIYNHSENKLYSSSKDNKINKAKSNSILKSKYSKNKIDNKKFLKLNKNIDNINIPLKIQKTDSVQKRNNDRIKNYKTIKKLELNKIINSKNKPKQGVDCHLERININSNFKTIKCLGNQLTERNNVHINNIINNKKYGFLENNLNNKKTKNSSSSLQKTIPSLKGTSSIDNKSTIKKGLINSIYDYNSQNNQDINNNKRKSNNNILKNMNKNKLIKKIETNNYENKNKNNANWNKNKANILSNNNIMVSKIRKISPINKKKQFIKTSISSDINITDSNKELSDLNKLVNNKINTIKIKEIKSIKISNIQKNDIKSRTSRRSNNFRNINDNNIKVKFGEDLGNISYKKDCNEKNGKNIKISNSKRLNIKKKNINKFN